MNHLPNVTLGRSSLSSRRLCALRAFATTLASTAVGALLAACTTGGGGPATPLGGCVSDRECSGDQVCRDGTCATPDETPDAQGPTPSPAKPDSGAPGSETPDAGGACVATGDACTYEQDCCNYLSGTGFCVDFGSGGACADSCTSDADCESGCCAATQGGGSVCSPPAFCPVCSAPGGPCTTTTDCCQTPTSTEAYGAVCLSNSNSCAAICYASDECTSGCCTALEGVTYGACGSAAGHTCL